MVYIICTFSIMGMIEPGVLKDDPAPFATAAIQIGGSEMRYFIAGGVAVATFGALNGWMLILGQVPKSIAEDDLFPAVFRKVNTKGVPAKGIVIGSTLVSIILAMNYSATLVKQFEFLTLLTTLSVLTPYLFSSAAYILLKIKQGTDKSLTKTYILSGLAFVYCMWTVIGAGQEVVFWGFILLILGVPFYLYIKVNHQTKPH
ncbi:MAG: amino acid permease [Bacteroidota bacterium]